ncbi:MAG: BamA/TamA family outer membrane protein [Cytophagaceae bacterium]|nr:BamA/TamA family outer membrane protein [Cytophagaceae bacterium]
MTFKREILCIALAGLSLLTGCVRKASVRRPDEFLLVDQSVKGNQEITSAELLNLVPQRPNRKILFNNFLPYLSLYRLGQQTYRKEKFQDELRSLSQDYQRQSLVLENDPKALRRLQNNYEKRARKLGLKIEQGNWVMRVLGEPPSYISQQNAADNAAKMRAYLATRGFRRASVGFTLDSTLFSRRQIKVSYGILEGPPSTMTRIGYQSAEVRLDSLMESNRKASKLAPGDRFDSNTLDAERSRLESLFRDNGYYGFNRNDISILGVDTFSISGGRRDTLRIDPIFIIAPPKRGETHPIYRVDSVQMVVDASPLGLPNRERTDEERNGVKYIFIGRPYATRLLDSKLSIRPGELYSQRRMTETQRRLGTLDQFRFPDMPFDTVQRRLNIYTNPLDKYQFSGEVGLNVFQGLPGPFTNAALRIRNILGGLESLELAGRLGVEGQTGFVVSDRPYASFEAGLNASLIFPQILFPGNYNFRFNNSNPRTQVGVGYNFSNRPDYRRTNAKLALSYSWQKTANETFYLSLFDANLNNSRIKDPAFDRYLDSLDQAGNPLKRSFQRSFVSSVSGSYVYSDNVIGQNRRAKYFRLFLELGGTTLNFTRNDEFPLLKKLFGDENLQFFKFYRINPEFRYYLPVGLRSTLAMRVNAGVALSYGGNDALPYEKYFFAGGSNSLRAWRPRRVGPGSSPNRPGEVDKVPEQPGNALLELSAELRFPIVKLGGQINGAVFVDAGNIWTTRAQAIELIGRANFDFSRFYREIALGTGFGVRWDFSFFIIRADWGVKLYEPALPVAQRWVLNKVSFRGEYKPKLNIGIGYPF